MAAPGRMPTARTEGRSDAAEWTEVPNAPFIDGMERPCPVAPRAEIPPVPASEGDPGSPGFPEAPHPSTVVWWEAIRVMPHARLWSEPDWIFAEDLCLLKERFYHGLVSDTGLAEVRRREDQIGTTVEARRKLRIRYVTPRAEAATTPAPAPAQSGPGVAPVTSITSRRDRLAAG